MFRYQREISEVSNVLQKLNTESNQVTDSEIREWILVGEEHLPQHSDESDAGEVVRIEPKVEHEAIRCLNTCLRWAEEN